MPEEMLKALPTDARKVWEDAYNSYKAKGYSDSRAARAAWGAVKQNWRKSKQGKWVTKEAEGPMDIVGMLLAAGAVGPYSSVVSDIGEVVPRMFRKALIEVGTWIDPNGTNAPFEVTAERIRHWIENFTAKRPELVPVPIGHSGFDNALMNTGYLRSLEFDGHWLWGVLEFTNEEAAKLVAEGSVPAASLGLDMDYLDTQTGDTYGEAIFHVALTNWPFIEGLPGFQAMSQDFGAVTVLEHRTSGDGGDRGASAGSGTKGEDTANQDSSRRVSMSAELEKLAAENVKTQARAEQLEKEMAQMRAERAKESAKVELGLAASIVSGRSVATAKFGLPKPKETQEKLVALLGIVREQTVELEKDKKISVQEVLLDLFNMILTEGLVPISQITLEQDREPGDESGKGFAEQQKKRLGLTKEETTK